MKKDFKTIFKNREGGYIFISHSHLDIKKVRVIRNTLEEAGFEPLCFYLKCLTDDDEVEGLIKREIDSRDIFIYVESKNSEASKWVQKEREYISKSNNKTIYTIAIDEDEEEIKEQTENILRRSRVFLSYSQQDKEKVNNLITAFERNDLQVIHDQKDILLTDEYESTLANSILEACDKGCYVVLISQNSIESSYVRDEMNLAFRVALNNDYNDCLVPVIVGDVDLMIAPQIYEYVSMVHSIKVSEELNKEDIYNILTSVQYTLNRKVIYKEVVRFIQGLDYVSSSDLQRQFNIGFNSSIAILNRLETDGYIIKENGKRKVIKK